MTTSKTQPRTLNLGCGLKHLPDAVNLDVTSTTNPDVVHDLNVRPWPFADDSFDTIRAYDVIEHLNDVIAAMEEIHRIAAPGGVVTITVPHFSSANAFTDPTHRHFFGWFTFHYLTGENDLPFYSNVRFKRRKTAMIFTPGLVNKLIWRLANRWPAKYERRWAWMFPAWFMSYELEIVKDRARAVHP